MRNYAAVVYLCSVRDVPKAVWNLFIKEFNYRKATASGYFKHTVFLGPSCTKIYSVDLKRWENF